MPINNYILATEPLSEALAQSVSRLDYAFHDTRFVVNYWRLSADRRLLFGGGENYTRRFPTDIRGFVRKYMLEIYPQLAASKIDYGWGGTLAVTMNRMPHFGHLPGKNIYFAQGYSGHGVVLASYAGKLLAEAVCGDAEGFDVMAKVPIPSFPGGTMLRRPGLVAGMLYYGLRDRLGW
jgi:gamma-glutamylputrescine oxidase